MRAMVKFLCLLSVLASPLMARAEIYPLYLYRVAGVAADDRLNIHDSPGADAAIIGALPPDSYIDVIDTSPDGAWALVSPVSGPGWIATRFLAIAAGQDPSGNGPPPPLPSRMACGGSSPAWGMELAPATGVTTYEGIDGGLWYAGATDVQQKTYPVSSLTSGLGRHYDKFAFSAGRFTGVLTRSYCKDDSTGDLFAWALDVVYPADGGLTMVSGCCSALHP